MSSYYISKSKIVQGERGLFATGHIKKGAAMFVDFMPVGKSVGNFEVDYKRSLPTSMINHSADPNTCTCFVPSERRFFRKAIKNISPGEEITSDYRHTMKVIKGLGIGIATDWMHFERKGNLL